ncbi:MAG: O-antigen ligase family protein [Verrucomicrobiaceae bacterium]
MTVSLPLIVSAGILLAVLTRVIGPVVTAIGAVIFTTCFLPIVALGTADEEFSVGISNQFIEWRTYTLLIIAMGIVVVLRSGFGCFSPMHLLFAGWTVYGLVYVWNDTPLVYAGFLQLMIGVLAWGVGVAVARMRHTAAVERAILFVLAGVVVFETMLCILQYGGLPINLGPEAGILGTRVRGTTNHPNTLGKLLFILLILLLPLTASRSAKVGRWAIISAGLLFVPFGLAQGRANLAALIGALLIWAVLTPNTRFSTSRRLALIPVAAIGIAATAGSVAARFEEDPTGGARSRLYEIAADAIPDHLWFGVGPNSYVVEIAQFYGSFIPVHNSFVLLLAETGVIGVALYFGPLLVAVARAITTARRNRYSRALVSTFPGWLMIGMTGWGLLGNSVLPFFMFAVAYTAERSRVVAREQGGSEGPENGERNRNPDREADPDVISRNATDDRYDRRQGNTGRSKIGYHPVQ